MQGWRLGHINEPAIDVRLFDVHPGLVSVHRDDCCFVRMVSFRGCLSVGCRHVDLQTSDLVFDLLCVVVAEDA